jgi:putative hydrolase of the HAD superfamily
MQEANGIRDRKIDAVIFDMDNTLFDFVEAKLRACKAVVECLERTDDLALLEYFLKDRKEIENKNNIAQYLSDRDIYSKPSFEKCCEVYTRTKLRNIVVYPGVLETLKEIKDNEMKLAVVTDADLRNAQARLQKTELFQYFEVVVAYDMVDKLKPQPDSINFALDKLKVTPEVSVLVGDSLDRDITPAKSLGMLTVYASYGDRNFNENRTNEADYTITNATELLNILNIKSN